MEVNKETLSLRENCSRTGSNVMVEGDIILPDVKPDMREILLADASVNTHSEEIRGGKLHIAGNVQFHLLYSPDSEECELTSMQTLLPFSGTVDVPDENADYTVHVTTEHIGFSRINSRKLSAKVIVSIIVRWFKTKTITPVTSVDDNTMQCRTNEYHVFLPLCETKNDISISDLLTVPSHLPDMDEILKTDAYVRDTDYKAMNGKVLIRGTLCVRTLYTAANEEISVEQVTHEIPFSEMFEAENTDENSRVQICCHIKTLNASPRGDMNGDTKIISIDAIIGATIKASTSSRITMVDDCYTTSGTVECEISKTTLSEPAILESSSFTESQTASVPAGVKASQILSVSAKAVLKECAFEEHVMHIRGTLVTFLLFRDDKGVLRSAVTETPFDRTKPVSEGRLYADCDIWTENTDAQVMGDGSVEIQTTIGYHVCVQKITDAVYITSCTRHNETAQGTQSPAIIIYFTEEGDTLWSVAKKYGTTVERIRLANHIEGNELTNRQKLIIPKSV